MTAAGTRPARRGLLTRTAVWAVLAADVALFCVFGIAHTLAGSPAAALVGQLAYLLPHATTTVLCTVLSVREQPGTSRRFWAYLAVSSLLLLTYESIFSYRALAGLPVDGPALDWIVPLPLAAAALFVTALVLLSRLGRSTALERTRVMLDTVLESTLTVLVVLALVIEPLLGGLGAGGEILVIGAVASTAGFFIVGWVVLNAAGYKTTPWQPWEVMVSAGLAVYGAGALLWPLYWLAAVPWQAPALAQGVSLLWMTGMGIVSVGAVHRLTDEAAGDLGFREAQPYEPPDRAWGMPATVIGGFLILWLWSGSAGAFPFMRDIVFSAAPVLAFVLTGRSALVLYRSERRASAALSDPISGLPTVTAFDRTAARGLEAAGRYGGSEALIVMDIDRFGEVNDARGHVQGDRVLAEVGSALRTFATRRDIAACRTTADEFAVLATDCDGTDAFKLTMRMQIEIEAATTRVGSPCTVSAGIAVFPDHGSDAAALFAAARDALSLAKAGDRGRVLVHDPHGAASRLGDARGAGSYFDTIRVLARSVEGRASHTRGHGADVAGLVVRLGRRLSLDEERVGLLEIAGELHDIGFVGVPDRVLDKPGPLDGAERALVHSHPEVGARILTSLDLPDVVSWVRAHHERFDGAGYPKGTASGEIPLGARVLAVCDAYAAMTAERPYRRALTRHEAIEELGRERGKQFDPAIVDEFFFVVSTSAGVGNAL